MPEKIPLKDSLKQPNIPIKGTSISELTNALAAKLLKQRYEPSPELKAQIISEFTYYILENAFYEKSFSYNSASLLIFLKIFIENTSKSSNIDTKTIALALNNYVIPIDELILQNPKSYEPDQGRYHPDRGYRTLSSKDKINVRIISGHSASAIGKMSVEVEFREIYNKTDQWVEKGDQTTSRGTANLIL